MEGTRQEHILGTCGKETFCGKEQEGEKRSEAGREDKNGGERSGEKEGGERGALQRLGSPWSPVPARRGVLQHSELGAGCSETEAAEGMEEPRKSLFHYLGQRSLRSFWGGAPLG